MPWEEGQEYCRPVGGVEKKNRRGFSCLKTPYGSRARRIALAAFGRLHLSLRFQ
jgi:hypothetical protein